MLDFVIGLAIFVGILIVLSICNFFSETYAQVKEKERYDLEQQKKKDELVLETQRKKLEQELELRKQAGLDPHFQEQDRKIKKYKAIVISLVAFLVLLVFYLLFFKNEPTTVLDNGASLIDPEINESALDESVVSEQKQNLPDRYVPVISNDVQVESNHATSFEPIEEPVMVDDFDVRPTYENGDSQPTAPYSRIGVENVGLYVGENRTVCGVISQISQTAQATYLNFGGSFPKHKFSAVIWSIQATPFTEGSNICVSGLIDRYKGIPQIVIDSMENQISIN
ncbi:hypothetical protein [Acinetobacter sp. YH12021]|uniref:hypothetical protein n=1 Tax=Acinetobacter sp. YH12021 TaxID=2601040 RepID=UPI0015D2F1C1|nr:hypothetical protein [Acinetobacter sp. YH12021]